VTFPEWFREFFDLCTLEEKRTAYRDGYADGVKDVHPERSEAASLKDVVCCAVCHEPWHKKEKRKIKMTAFVHVDEISSEDVGAVKSENHEEAPNNLPLATAGEEPQTFPASCGVEEVVGE